MTIDNDEVSKVGCDPFVIITFQFCEWYTEDHHKFNEQYKEQVLTADLWMTDFNETVWF